VTNILFRESKAKAVGRGTPANLISEKPAWTSDPSSSTTEAGIVGGAVGVAEASGGGLVVAVSVDVERMVVGVKSAVAIG